MPKEKDGFRVAKGSPGSWNDQCVAVRIGNDAVEVIDTKNDTSPILKFNESEWKVFIEGVKNGEFDV